jgi:hypothetical protein
VVREARGVWEGTKLGFVTRRVLLWLLLFLLQILCIAAFRVASERKMGFVARRSSGGRLQVCMPKQPCKLYRRAL